MTGPVNSIKDLVLLDEMEVEVRGQLVVRGSSLVVTGYHMLTPKPGELPDLRWELTPFVALDLTPEQELEYEELLGETVYGRGVWTGSSVELTSLVADDSWTRAAEADHARYRKDFTQVSEDIRRVEVGLFASGIVLRRVRLLDEEGLRVIVAASDVDAAFTALAPIYGEALEVLPSRWTPWELRDLDDELNDLSDDKVLKVEFRMNGDGVISRKLRVNFVDAELVQTLGRFPDEMLVVEAVVEPLGAPQQRDIWFPARPRRETRADPETRAYPLE